MSEKIEVRETSAGELFVPTSHLALEGQAQALCGTWVADETATSPFAPCCQVCADLGLAYLDYYPGWDGSF